MRLIVGGCKGCDSTTTPRAYVSSGKCQSPPGNASSTPTISSVNATCKQPDFWRSCSVTYRKRDKPRQGVVASTLNAFRGGALDFIDWLDVLAWRHSNSFGRYVIVFGPPSSL